MDESVRIALIVRAERIGGAERYLTRLYGGLIDSGIRATLLGDLPGWPLDQTATAEELDLGPKWSRRTLVRGVLRARGEAERVVHRTGAARAALAHMQFKREQIAFTRPLSRHLPVIWTEHGVMSHSSPLRLPYAAAARAVARVICVSEQVADSLAGIVADDKIVVIENGLDVPQVDRSTGVNSDGRFDRTVLWVGRLDRGKRPGLALQYARAYPSEQVLIVGDGEERERMQLEAATLPNVTLVGHTDQVGRYYSAADVVMFTSSGRGEGMPTVLVEAAAYGTPVVTHVGSGAEKFVLDSGGRVVANTSDMGSWASEMSKPELYSAEPRSTWAARHNLSTWLDHHRRVIESVAC